MWVFCDKLARHGSVFFLTFGAMDVASSPMLSFVICNFVLSAIAESCNLE